MSSFSAKQVKRSIRNFESASEDVLNFTYPTFKSRINRLYDLTQSDEVIRFIVEPLLSMKIDFDSIHKSNIGGMWINEVNLPTDQNAQIAYFLQLISGQANHKINLENLTGRIYKKQRIEDNLIIWVQDIAKPCLRELAFKLNDLIEDEVEGKDEVQNAKLQIFNYGSITASDGSNVAIGSEINQSASYKSIVKEIMDSIKNTDNIVPADKMEETEEIIRKLEAEINSQNPSESKLKDFASKLFDIGKQGLLKIVSGIVLNPMWTDAVANTLLNNF